MRMGNRGQNSMTTAGQQQTHHHERTVVSAFTSPVTEALSANTPARVVFRSN
jgi:hypothetical protein